MVTTQINTAQWQETVSSAVESDIIVLQSVRHRILKKYENYMSIISKQEVCYKIKIQFRVELLKLIKIHPLYNEVL